jgi:hypothetical protein
MQDALEGKILMLWATFSLHLYSPSSNILPLLIAYNCLQAMARIPELDELTVCSQLPDPKGRFGLPPSAGCSPSGQDGLLVLMSGSKREGQLAEHLGGTITQLLEQLRTTTMI